MVASLASARPRRAGRSSRPGWSPGERRGAQLGGCPASARRVARRMPGELLGESPRVPWAPLLRQDWVELIALLERTTRVRSIARLRCARRPATRSVRHMGSSQSCMHEAFSAPIREHEPTFAVASTCGRLLQSKTPNTPAFSSSRPHQPTDHPTNSRLHCHCTSANTSPTDGACHRDRSRR